MTGIEPDRDVIERMPRWQLVCIDIIGALLMTVAFLAVMYALDVSLVTIGKR